MKLHLGCGRLPREGWVNLDMTALPGVDVVFNLDDCGTTPLPFDDDTFDIIEGIDLIEHIREPLALMQELYRVAKPDAVCHFELPYGSSDDAWEDPTHRRPYFIGSWAYFGQPFYYRADYGFRADWSTERVELAMPDPSPNQEELYEQVMLLRNCVARQAVSLRAVKPAREPLQELITPPPVVFTKIGG